jgi:CubicO group peptidase (beta-lactamase class C family)
MASGEAISMLDRRRLLFGAAALAAGTASTRAATTLANSLEWETATSAETGFVPDFEARLDQFAQSGVGNLHGVVVARHGRLVLEKYYEGEDMLRDGRGGVYPERVAFSAERLHEVRSITKSMVSLLYGIALRDGKVPSPDAPLLAQFPQYADIAEREQRSRWTIAHALTMTLGIEWNEDISYDDPRNGQTAMEAAADRCRYVLERPIVAAAGERWNYCGGATALIGKILENGTGQKAHDYARAVLFDPLGLGPTVWRISRDRELNFPSGLAMRPRDLARVGQLLVDRGKAGAQQLVPADWLDASFKPAASIRERREYGYHWYLGKFNAAKGPFSERWIAAHGNGDQRLFVFPGLELVAVVTAGNYNSRDQGNLPIRVMTELVLPNLR